MPLVRHDEPWLIRVILCGDVGRGYFDVMDPGCMKACGLPD